jgi:hypothetical protein
MSAESQHSAFVCKGTLRFFRCLLKKCFRRLLELSRRGDCPSEISVFSRDSWAEEKRRNSAALQNIRVIRAIRGVWFSQEIGVH